MSSQYLLDGTARSRPGKLSLALGLSALLHVILGILIVFDVAGIGGGFGLGVGPGFGMGTGGGVGLGKEKRRQIFSLEDLPKPVPPQDPKRDDEVKDLVVARTPEAVVIPQQAKPRAVSTTPVVQFARPVRPIAAGTDLGARFASAGASASRSTAPSASTSAACARSASTWRSWSTPPAACRTSSTT